MILWFFKYCDSITKYCGRIYNIKNIIIFISFFLLFLQIEIVLSSLFPPFSFIFSLKLSCRFWIGWYNFRQFAVSFLLYLWGIWCISLLQFIYHRILKNVLKEPSSNLLIFSGTMFDNDFVKLMTTMIHDDDINLKSINLTIKICV